MQSTQQIVSRLTFLLAVAVAVTAASGSALAQAGAEQPAAPNPPPSVVPTPAAQADDSRAMVRLAFGRADANKDGKLTPAEAGTLPPVAAKFNELDANKDGVISEDEFVAGVRIEG